MPREANSSFGKLLRLEVLVMRPWNRIRFMERERDAMQPLHMTPQSRLLRIETAIVDHVGLKGCVMPTINTTVD